MKLYLKEIGHIPSPSLVLKKNPYGFIQLHFLVLITKTSWFHSWAGHSWIRSSTPLKCAHADLINV